MKRFKIIFAIILAISLSACLLGCKISLKELVTLSEKNSAYHSERRMEKTATAAAGVNALKTSANVGDISVSYGSAKSIHADAYIKLSSNKNKNLAQILKKYDIKISQKNKSILIQIVNKRTGKSIDDLTNSDHSVNIQNMRLTVSVPKTIRHFWVRSDVGDISLNGTQGTVDAQTDTGDINITNPYLYGHNSLQTDVGNIRCSFDKAQVRGGTMTLTSDTGDIHVTAHSTKLYSRIKNEDAVGASAQFKIAGSFSITAETSVGAIDLK